MKRRALLFTLVAIAAPAMAAASEPQPPVIEWVRCSVTTADGVRKGILVTIRSNSDADTRAFEVAVRWRHDFLGRGEQRELRVVVTRDASGNGTYFAQTGGDESWIQVQAWGLVQRECTVTSGV